MRRKLLLSENIEQISKRKWLLVYIIQYEDNDGNNQKWRIVDIGNGRYQIRNKQSGLLLDVNGRSLDACANVIQWNNNGGTNQMWNIYCQ